MLSSSASRHAPRNTAFVLLLLTAVRSLFPNILTIFNAGCRPLLAKARFQIVKKGAPARDTPRCPSHSLLAQRSSHRAQVSRGVPRRCCAQASAPHKRNARRFRSEVARRSAPNKIHRIRTRLGDRNRDSSNSWLGIEPYSSKRNHGRQSVADFRLTQFRTSSSLRMILAPCTDDANRPTSFFTLWSATVP